MITRWFALLCLVLSSNFLQAAEYYVSEPGVDDTGRAGSLEQPWRQIRWVLGQGILKSGDTLTALPGTYQYLSLWDAKTLFDPQNPVLLRSSQLHAARTDGVNAGKATGMILDGFEFSPGRTNQNLVQLAWPDVHDVVLRDCLIHDAAPGGDCLKINAGAHHILVEGCVIYDPGDRSTGGYPTETWQENVDLYDAHDITVRKCWIYHTGGRGDHVAYTKGTSTNILFENNVIGPQSTTAHEGALSAGSRSTDSKDGFVAFDVTFRGNVLFDCGYSAIGVYAVKNTTIRDNIIYNSGYRPSPIYPQEPAPITFRISEGALPDPLYRSEGTTIEGNLVIGLGNLGPVALAPDPSTVVDGLTCRDNRYWNAGKPVSSEGLYDPNTESGARFDNPGLNVPSSYSLDELSYDRIMTWFSGIDFPTPLEPENVPALPGKSVSPALLQNQPNPFNPSTRIAYRVSGSRPVRLKLTIHDLRGRQVGILWEGYRAPGAYSMTWDGTDRKGRPLPSGVYLYRLEAGEMVFSRKLVLLR